MPRLPTDLYGRVRTLAQDLHGRRVAALDQVGVETETASIFPQPTTHNRATRRPGYFPTGESSQVKSPRAYWIPSR